VASPLVPTPTYIIYNNLLYVHITASDTASERGKWGGRGKRQYTVYLLQGQEENGDWNELGKKGIGTGRMLCRLEGVEGGRS